MRCAFGERVVPWTSASMPMGKVLRVSVQGGLSPGTSRESHA